MSKKTSVYEISESDEVIALIITPSFAKMLRDNINVYLRLKSPKDDEEKMQISFHGKLTILVLLQISW